MISITCATRKKTSKGDVKRLRRDGRIPYVIYSNGQTPEQGSLAVEDFDSVIRSIQPGFITTTVFSLTDDAGKKCTALIKEIQYHPTTYKVLHLDFLKLEATKEIDIKVPLEFMNAVDCVGVKLGGYLRHIMRHIPVRCLPKDIPSYFEIDVKDLGIRQSRRIQDVSIPKQVNCLARPEDVVVTVAK